MTPKTEWDTTHELPFWLRRIDVAVHGQTAAQQRVEFNWWLVYAPMCATVGGLLATGALGVAALIEFTVSAVEAFPVVSALLLLALLFKRQRRGRG
ncbi:hypothetical protein DF039_37285 [Burkholderia cenocepacia]|nr:hypothetical protein DF039_37285 [Burkholderia cenocepacia]